MRKYCDICGIEIADTDYDSWYRFISVKYCDECRIDVRKEQKKNSKKKQQVKKRAENAVSREEQRLSEAEYVAQCKTDVACHAKRKKLTRKTKKTLLNTTFKSVFYYL